MHFGVNPMQSLALSFLGPPLSQKPAVLRCVPFTLGMKREKNLNALEDSSGDPLLDYGVGRAWPITAMADFLACMTDLPGTWWHGDSQNDVGLRPVSRTSQSSCTFLLHLSS